MAILLDEQTKTISMQGVCSVEESETLLDLVDSNSADGVATVDLSELEHMHTACLQVLLERKPRLTGQSKTKQLNNFLNASNLNTGEA